MESDLSTADEDEETEEEECVLVEELHKLYKQVENGLFELGVPHTHLNFANFLSFIQAHETIKKYG